MGDATVPVNHVKDALLPLPLPLLVVAAPAHLQPRYRCLQLIISTNFGRVLQKEKRRRGGDINNGKQQAVAGASLL
jgi:hypothetical protein